MKTCEDYKGSCCGSCHDDADEGYGELLEIEKDRKVVARVCCRKIDEAENEFIYSSD